MADKTFGVKVSEELHEKVREMIENSGDSVKDWFEKAVALTEIQNIKQGATDYSQDLNELEIHTARIYRIGFQYGTTFCLFKRISRSKKSQIG